MGKIEVALTAPGMVQELQSASVVRLRLTRQLTLDQRMVKESAWLQRTGMELMAM